MKASARNEFDFREYKHLKPFFEDIYNGRVSIIASKREQRSFATTLDNCKDMVQDLKIILEIKTLFLITWQNIMKEEN